MAEGARLESVYTSDRIVGSNPTFTAIQPKRLILLEFQAFFVLGLPCLCLEMQKGATQHDSYGKSLSASYREALSATPELAALLSFLAQVCGSD